MKFAQVVFLAGFLSVRTSQGKLNDTHQTLIPVGLMLLAMAVVVIGLQKDLGTGITIVGIVMTMLFVTGLHARFLWIAVGVSVAVAV